MVGSLQSLRAALRENSSELIQGSLTNISHNMEKVISAEVTIGTISNALEKAEKAARIAKDSVKEEISLVEDGDIFTLTSDFQQAQSLLQSTLSSSSQLLQPSLLNFMMK